MKLTILDLKANEVGTMDAPAQFLEPVRLDLIKRAAAAMQSRVRQPYGANPRAGMRHSAELSRRRKDYRGSYGHGISRVPRKIMTRRGTRMHWVGAQAPGTVGGRRAHAPKACKDRVKNINVKERKKAIRSAIAASLSRDYTTARGHKTPDKFPFIVSAEFEKVSKTKDVLATLKSFGLEAELERVSERSIRAGKGKMRGRKYKTKSGPIIVVSDDCELSKIGNIQGFEVVRVNDLNALTLAPGVVGGRLALYTDAAVKKVKEANLFV